MRAGRARVGVRLRSGLRQSINDYPLAVALSDLNDYYDAGTILGALAGITELVGTQAREELQRPENVTLTGDPNKASTSIPQPPTSGVTRIEVKPPAQASTVQGAETQWEKALVASQLERIQSYLCAAQIDGKIGVETRDLIKIGR